MAYTGEKKRQYDREWRAKRRLKWIVDNGPCKLCGSLERLEIDHIDRTHKSFNPRELWSRKEQIREAELTKCQVLCEDCHKKKTADEQSIKTHGSAMYRRGCRCDICRNEAVNKVSEWRWKNGRRNKKCGQVDIAET